MECANAAKHDLSGLPKGWGLGKSQNPESSLSWGLVGCCEEHETYHGNSRQRLMEREGGHSTFVVLNDSHRKHIEGW